MKWSAVVLAGCVVAASSGCWRPYYGQTYAPPVYGQPQVYQQPAPVQQAPVYQQPQMIQPMPQPVMQQPCTPVYQSNPCCTPY